MRRLVERRIPQLIIAASAGGQEVIHAPAVRRCFPIGVQSQDYHLTVSGLPLGNDRAGGAQACALTARRIQDDLAQCRGIRRKRCG